MLVSGKLLTLGRPRGRRVDSGLSLRAMDSPQSSLP